jgi:hypothetical protein
LEVAGAETISKKPNKQRNEVGHSLKDIRHTEQNELAESNSLGYCLRYKTGVTPYVQTSTLPVDAQAIR